MAGGGNGPWARLPLTARAIISGLAVGLVGANVWSVLVVALGPTVVTALAEIAFLILYIAWAGGKGWPVSTQAARAVAFRAGWPGPAKWGWGLLAAVAFAVSVHAALVVLFRLIPFPAAAFHQGYDLSRVPGQSARWAFVVIAAASAGVCEETGFRGYLQQPIEARHGPVLAIAASAVLFTLAHLNKAWLSSGGGLLMGMFPIVLGAGILLGLIAWASRSLIFTMIGHTLMDIGLFAFWWTQIAGVFSVRTIFAGGIDTAFAAECAVLLIALAVTLTAIFRLRGAQAAPVLVAA
jgi:membrane protease YdiL (CAAX protease family)